MARSYAAVHVDAAPIFLHNAMAHPESQAGSSFSFGGEEGIKDAAQVFATDAMAIIGNADAHSWLPGVAPVARLEDMYPD